MLIDIVVLIIICYFIVIGFRRGIWLSLLHFASSIVSLFIASQYYQSIAQRLVVFVPFPKTVAFDMVYTIPYDHLQYRFEKVIAFIIIFGMCKLILYLVVVTFDNIITYKKIHLVSRISSVVLSIIAVFIYLQIGLYLLSLYPHSFIQYQLSQSLLSRVVIEQIPYLSQFILNL
ncbi:CvpA family protein [Staphylococcus epidermidis]|uniref:CvpA family protein n=1 Tax=Staphylococcus epidermidis TaxID=1282 RepID=UPI003EE045C4